MVRPINPDSARQRRLAKRAERQRKLFAEHGVMPGQKRPRKNQLTIPVGLADLIREAARDRRMTRTDHPELNPFVIRHALHPPGVVPDKEVRMAMDSSLNWAGENWQTGGFLGSVFAEGQVFPGYPYLAELAQRPEYRAFSEIISTEMTRKWIKFSGKGEAHQQRKNAREMAEDFGLPDPYPEEREEDEKPETSEKQEKIAQLEEFLDNLHARDAYRALETNDGLFGRSHLFHEIGGNDGSTPDGREELQSDIGIGVGDLSRSKVSPQLPLTNLQPVEPVWTYPTTYNAMNPLQRSWYNPQVWYTMGMPIHCSRLFTQIGRPVPDLLKPAYSFGGISLSQLAQPYVDIWLQTRESVGRLVHAFSTMVLKTDLQTLMQPGGKAILERAELFNVMRDNNQLFLLNKNTEDFSNVSAPLSGLHELQAQAQEHLCVQAGTLVETQRGSVTIEELTRADMVLTRGGLAPLKWVGVTGHVDSLVEIATDHATIKVTQCHPIWSETTKQFVPAWSVRPSHHLLGLETSSRGNMARPSRGAADGGGEPKRAIIATKKAAACSIASFGRRIAAQFRLLMTSITETMMRSTILSTTWSLLPGLNTLPAMSALASMSSTKNTPRNVFSVETISPPSFPIRQCIVPMLASAKLTRFAMDGSRRIISSNAANVGVGSNPSEKLRASVPTAVGSVLVGRVEVRAVPRQPVYNLEVDGPPEFFANGILVHNCSVSRIPTAIYTGISPTGLNASSEGEIRIFENTIHAFQEARFRRNLTMTVNFAQLSLWGEVDPDIVFDFVPLRELTEKEEAELRKIDAETDDVLVNGCNALSPEEVRRRIAGDENGPHAGIDPDDMPEPPQPPPGEGGEGGEGGPQLPGGEKPGGRINTTGREAYTGTGAQREEPAGDEMAADDVGDPGPTGGTFASLAEPDPNAPLHPGYQPGPMRGVNPVDPKKKHLTGDAEFNESDHPRDQGGKFTSGGGQGGGAAEKPTSEAPKGLAGLFSGSAKLKKVGEKLGSNEGGTYENDKGHKFYIKKGKSAAHVASEKLAGKLFRLAGGRTLKYEDAGPDYIATRWEKMDKNNINQFNKDEKAQARADFARHAWIANWDAAGTGNDNYSSKGGQTLPNDLGGALEWRAMGSPKGDAFGNSVGEWDTLRDPSKSKQNAALFKGMSKDELRRSAQPVALVSDRDIKAAVQRAGKPPEMAEKLIARKRDLEQRANGDPKDKENPVTFDLGGELPVKTLNGIPFKAWEPPPNWKDVDGTIEDLEGDDKMNLDPEGTGTPKRASTGIFMVEPDGRVWLMRPTNGFGGYDQTIPKGGMEKGLTYQQNAIKEVWEETGLKANILGIVGDAEGDKSVTRYYFGERAGGDPTDHEWEASAVMLVPPKIINEYLNRSRDREVAKYIIDNMGEDSALASDAWSEGDHPRDEGGKFTPKGSGSFGKKAKTAGTKAAVEKQAEIDAEKKAKLIARVTALEQADADRVNDLHAKWEQAIKAGNSDLANELYDKAARIDYEAAQEWFANPPSWPAPEWEKPTGAPVSPWEGQAEAKTWEELDKKFEGAEATAKILKQYAEGNMPSSRAEVAALKGELSGFEAMTQGMTDGEVLALMQGPPKEKAKKAKPGSKLEIIGELLKKGTTTKDILAATGWPSVSVPAQAKALGLDLVKVKDGKTVKYYGKPKDVAAALAGEPAEGAPGSALNVAQNLWDEGYPADDVKSKMVKAGFPSAEVDAALNTVKDKYFAPENAKEKTEEKNAELAKQAAAEGAAHIFQGEGVQAKIFKSGVGKSHVVLVDTDTGKAVGGVQIFPKGEEQKAVEWAKNLAAGKDPHQGSQFTGTAVPKKASVEAEVKQEPEKPKGPAPQASPSDLEKAKKATGFYAPQGIPPSMEGKVAEFNKKYQGKELTDPAALNEKVAEYKALKADYDTAMVKEQAAMVSTANAKKEADYAHSQAQKAQQQAASYAKKEKTFAQKGNGYAAVAQIYGDSKASYWASDVKSKAKAHFGVDLTDGEAAAIGGYTDGLYSELNTALRMHTMTPAQHSAFIAGNSGLAKLPSYTQETRRGTTLNAQQLAYYAVGQVVQEHGFASSGKGKGWSGNTKFHITGTSGKDVSKLSASGENEGGGEVLWPAKLWFKVTKKEVKDGITHIHMEEALG